MNVKIVVFLGPSASGKTRLQQQLGLKKVVTHTTRPPRPGEEEGRDYYFCSREAFLSGIAAGDFIEHTEYAGAFYGTSKKSLQEAIEGADQVGIVLDQAGAETLKGLWPKSVLVVGVYASREVVLARLMARNNPEGLNRMANYDVEVQGLLRLSDIIFPSNQNQAADEAKDLEMALMQLIKFLDKKEISVSNPLVMG